VTRRLPTVSPRGPIYRECGIPYLPRFEDVVADLELDGFFPLPEFNHQQFLRDLGQSAWLEEWESTLAQLRLGLIKISPEQAAAYDAAVRKGKSIAARVSDVIDAIAPPAEPAHSSEDDDCEGDQ
jgi:hypothetical protein